MRVLFAALALLLAACEGAEGPAGPPGPPGSLNRFVGTAVVDAEGWANVSLPAAAGSNSANPPGIECYISTSVTAGSWLNITDGEDATSANCGLILLNGVWQAVVAYAPAGWVALIIATW